jgi:hypothetical protein
LKTLKIQKWALHWIIEKDFLSCTTASFVQKREQQHFALRINTQTTSIHKCLMEKSIPNCVFKSVEQSKKLVLANKPSELVLEHWFCVLRQNNFTAWKSSKHQQKEQTKSGRKSFRHMAELVGYSNSFMDNRKLNTEFIT